MQGRIVREEVIHIPDNRAYTIRVRQLGRRRFVMDALSYPTPNITFVRRLSFVRSLPDAEIALARAHLMAQIPVPD